MLHTIGNIKLGGVNNGLFKNGYHVWMASIWNYEAMSPTLKQIITATSAGIILFIIDYFVLCNNK